MFEVLVFVYENYWRGDACPETPQLERKLSAVGFAADEIAEAMRWLDGLQLAALGTDPALVVRTSGMLTSMASPTLPAHDSMRVYSVAEQDRLGAECLGFVQFLENAGVLPAAMREIVLDRAMVTGDNPVSLDDLKIIILMVYWSFGEEPDALVLDELCDDASDRVAH
jgi:Smg protein